MSQLSCSIEYEPIEDLAIFGKLDVSQPINHDETSRNIAREIFFILSMKVITSMIIHSKIFEVPSLKDWSSIEVFDPISSLLKGFIYR